MVSLSSLSPKVLGHITDTLDIPDFCSFRSVSREVNKKTFHNFANTCFGTLQTNLGSTGIDRLRRFSEEHNLVPHVHTLLFNDGDSPSGQIPWRSSNDYSLNHLTLQSPSVPTLCSLLTNKFTSCRSFRIEDENRAPKTADAIANILAVITQTGLHAKSFSIQLGNHGSSRIDMIKMDHSLYQNIDFQNAWSHLRELSLAFTIDRDAFDWTINLITHARSLQRLSLSLAGHESEAFFTRLVAVGGLPKLEELEIRNTRVSKETLLTLLLHFHSTLRKLALHGVAFDLGAWPAAFLEMRHAVSKLNSLYACALNDNGGRIIFPTLRQSPQILRAEGIVLKLVNEAIGFEPQVAGVHYQGEDISSALELLAGSAAYYERV